MKLLSLNRRSFLRVLGSAALAFPLRGRAGAHGPITPQVLPPANPTGFEPTPGAWSFVLLPDTQYYSQSHPDVFVAQTEWIARERAARNIQFVLHLGDVVNNNLRPEWDHGYHAMEVLQKAQIPFLIASGNHDLGTWGAADNRRSFFGEYFIQRGRTRGEPENAYRVFTIGAAKILVVVLEFGPRDAVVDWANELVARYPDHHAILLTHAYMFSDNTRYDWKTKGKTQGYNPCEYPIGLSPEGCNDGEALWQKLVRRHPQFLFTFNGHVIDGSGLGYLQSAGDQGNAVHQVLVNYQTGVTPDRKNGGGGFLRLLEVSPDGRTVRIRDYSPYYDQWLTDPGRCFDLALDRSFTAAFVPPAKPAP